MKKLSPRMMMILPMIIFGTLGLFVRNIDLPSAELAFYRAVMAAALIGMYLAAAKIRIRFSNMKNKLPLLLISGFLREDMTLWQAVGGLLILGFTLWNELGTKDKKGNHS